MKDKKGFIFGIIPLIYMSMAIVLLILLVWFGFRISDGLVAVFDFLKQWWWAIGLTIFWLSPVGRAIMKAILKKIGIKV